LATEGDADGELIKQVHLQDETFDGRQQIEKSAFGRPGSKIGAMCKGA
jgi:hypothetical protein